MRCPDCIDGKRRIALTVPHPCHACAMGEPQDCDGHPRRITVAQAVVEWGPLVVVPDAKRIPVGDCLILRSDGKQVLRWEKNQGVQRVALPPNVDPQSLVDQYAIGLRIVNS